MKKIIRLTESDLHNIIKGSVNKILKESIESLGVKFGYYLRYDEDEKSYYGIKVDKE